MTPHQNQSAIAFQKPNSINQAGWWLSAIAFLALSLINPLPSRAQNRILLREFPESEDGMIRPDTIAIDRDRNLYLTGDLFSVMARETPLGALFVAKYDRNGNQIWQHNSFGVELLGSSASALDKSGNLYFTGYYTFNSIVPGIGTVYEFWIAKYNSAGELLWQDPIDQQVTGIVVDPDENFYLVGTTFNNEKSINWIAKYDRDRHLQWKQEFSELESSYIASMTLDSNNHLYIAGNHTAMGQDSNTNNQDVWVAKYDSNGNRLWIQELGSAESDRVSGIATDDTNGNIYLTGYSNGDLGGTNAGQDDVWVAKYNQDGTLLWTQLFGSDRREVSTAIQVNAAGNIYITGYEVSTGSNSNYEHDGWIISYDPNGNLQWRDRIATPEYDTANALAIDDLGDIYVAGFSGNAGWIFKYQNPR